MKINKVVIFGLLLAFAFGGETTALAAKESKKKDNMQLAYQMITFNGKGYSENFVPTSEKTFSIIADQNNVITPKTVDIAWSDEAGEYMADWDNWEHPAKEVGAKLQVLKDGKIVDTIDKTDVAMYYPNLNDQDQSTLLAGKEATEAFKRYSKAQDEYWDASAKYQEEQANYDEAVAELQGTPGAVLPKAPQPPQEPAYYVSAPIKAFVINLPKGEYEIKTLDKSGRVIKDSEKTIMTFTARRKGIGYSIKPEAKWTYPENNDDPTSIIYYVGQVELFFNPEQENEYNIKDYTKLLRPNSPFSNNAPKDQWTWVHVNATPKAKLKLYKNGKLDDTIVDRPYIVEQTPGAALGYNIVDFAVRQDKSQEPTFTAHKVVLRDKGVFKLQYVDENGKVDPSGYREARPIKDINSNILFLISIIPFIFGLIVAAVRAIRTKSQHNTIAM